MPLTARQTRQCQVELPPSARSVEHEHLGDGAEDLYVGIAGSGKVVVDGDEVALRPGTFVLVTPESSRFVQADETGLVYLAICGSVAWNVEALFL